MKKIASTLSTVVILFCSLLVVVGVYYKLTGNNVLPMQMVWVLTDSMEDTIPARSYILIKKADASEVKEGDVITFVSSDPSIRSLNNTHRVIAVNTDGTFVTKGDHNPGADLYPVQPENVVGIYVRNMPVLTFFGRMFASSAGFILFLFFILGSFALSIANRLKEEKKKEFEEKVKAEVAKLEQNPELLRESLKKQNEGKD
ncbi:MAG: signal peptidase I [Clostridia bacterium]|nr:signal peptidase I [Clostridia bacterium]